MFKLSKIATSDNKISINEDQVILTCFFSSDDFYDAVISHPNGPCKKCGCRAYYEISSTGKCRCSHTYGDHDRA